MITEERAVARFKEANPVPDANDLVVSETSAAGYLATLEQRSSEMTQLDEQPAVTEEKKRQRLWLRVAFAAAAIAVLAVGVSILSNQDDNVVDTPPVTEPAPAPEPTVPSTVVPETTPEPAGPTSAELVAISTDWLGCVSLACRSAMEPFEADGLALPGNLPLEDFIFGLEQTGVEVITVDCEAVVEGGPICQRTFNDVFGRVWGFETEETYRFFFDGTTITGFNWSIDHSETLDAYVSWLEENHRDEYDTACPEPPAGTPQACVAFYQSHTAEFEQSEAFIPPPG